MRRTFRILAALLLLAASAGPAIGADGFIIVPPDSTGKSVDHSSLIVAGNTVFRQRFNLCDPTNAAGCAAVDALLGLSVNVKNSTLAVTQSGLWNIGFTGSLPAGTALLGGVELYDGGGVNKAAIDASGALAGNVTKFGGTALSTGTGVGGLGIPRVTVSSDSFPATQPVSGTVAVSNFPATQPVSGTVTANAGSGTFTTSDTHFPASAALSDAISNPTVTLFGAPMLLWDATNTVWRRAQADAGTGTMKVDPGTVAVTGTFFQATQPISGSVSVSNFPATQPVSGSVAVSNFPATQPVSGTVTDNQGTANTATNGWPVKVTDGTNIGAVKAASTAAAATDPSTVTQLSPNQPQLTTPLNVQGGKTNNAAAPGATNIGALGALANAAPPAYTEGDEVLQSTDLGGNTRVYAHPPAVLGCYQINGRTPTYAGLAAGAPLYSLRWGNASNVAIIWRVQIFVVTTVTATTAGLTERELVIARGFTASDTGGTAVTLTGNNNKMRTAQGTSLVTDMRFGGALTAGTRTLDANPVASTAGWSPLTTVGIVIGAAGGTSGEGFVDLFNATNGQQYPIVLATNEGIIVRIGKDAQAAGATQQTYLNVNWCEASAY